MPIKKHSHRVLPVGEITDSMISYACVIDGCSLKFEQDAFEEEVLDSEIEIADLESEGYVNG